MSRSDLFRQLRRSIRIARFADQQRLSTSAALEKVQEAEHKHLLSRRSFLTMVGGGAALGAAMLAQPNRALAGLTSGVRIAIVGGGTAGVSCAFELAGKGISSTIYEAHANRLGGRMWSSHRFNGQVVERGGEMIDTAHKTMLGYVNALGLTLEDLNKNPGEVFYYFQGRHYSEAQVVDEYRVLAKRMRPDLQRIGQPTFFSHTEAEKALDFTDLASYLDRHASDLPLIRGVLDAAYNVEYGLETHQQSCLNLLLFIHLDSRRQFAPYGVFSDERYHVIEGSDQVPKRLAEQLPGNIHYGMRLTRLRRNTFGEFELFFNNATTPEVADAVVLAIPFSVLRNVQLEDSLGLSADKKRVISSFVYGQNVKTMIGFHGRPWVVQGGNGDIYSDLPNIQNTWETNYSRAGATSVLTDYAGGNRARSIQFMPISGGQGSCGGCHSGPGGFMDIHDEKMQQQVDAFLTDLDLVVPGAKQSAIQTGNGYLAERAHWGQQSYSRGSYTGNQPGYFTTIAGLEAQSCGALKFAGEHTNSFYEWQGFMEGAALSGVAAAAELIDDIRARRIA
ncbi:MAG: FAD-dependent oxidoreductase [Gammaproteobacteria bacterium]|nr:FAD-dependent oxidoreductase [Gammaproteobacteria bacterium]